MRTTDDVCSHLHKEVMSTDTQGHPLKNQYPEASHTIIHISDTHLIGNDDGLYSSTSKPDLYLKELFSRLEESGAEPDVIIFTGDLADQGETAAYEKIRKIVEPAVTRMGAELIWVMGNHDDRFKLRESLTDETPSYEPVDKVYDINGLRLIVLDSTVPGHHYGLVSPEQRSWLKSILSTPAEHGTILALHHPPLPSVLPLASVVELQEQDDLATVLRGTDVRSIIAGHLHYSSFGTFAGIPVSVASSTCYTQDLMVEVGGTRGHDEAQGFNVIKVFPNTILHSAVPLKEGSTVGKFVRRQEVEEILKKERLVEAEKAAILPV